MYSKVCLGKRLSGAFPIHNSLKLGGALLSLCFNFGLENTIKNAQEYSDCNSVGHISFSPVLMVLIFWVKT
jgi:hypothetical protein